ncbi:3121_t:CDS:2 [Rhizophagus irregularis]|nr:3121_t:CDS:2 [Rhizophagus irregularis]
MDIDKEDKEMAQHAGVTLNFKNLLIGLDEPSSEIYRIQIRDSNKTTSILHLSERLFQQYLVDQYAKWESNQQNFIYMQQLYQDSMAIVREYEKPDLFITITCNPNWPKITNELLPNQKARYNVCVIEFQKRVLPHAHILMILLPEDKPKISEVFDKLVCAEIPDKNHQLLLFGNITSRNIIHRPCGNLNPNPLRKIMEGQSEKEN